ncbi:MAG: AAA family ATPase [Lachnospiraceae bacterium]|nr:AAA family ATPase [Lachnospiraceae bacterium]
MTTEELIKYIYETSLENTSFEGTQQKGDRGLILLRKYGKDKQHQLVNRFGDKVTFNNITPSTAIDIIKKIEEYLVSSKKSTTSLESKCVRIYQNKYTATVIESKNVIFHGAPGTGKSFLAKSIAADIVSGGEIQQYDMLSDDKKKQIEFVQFHPSYDYTDFVEGLRPKINDDNGIGFELQDGIFKSFVEKAKKNYIASQKSITSLSYEQWVDARFDDFIVKLQERLGNEEEILLENTKQKLIALNDDHLRYTQSKTVPKGRIFYYKDIKQAYIEKCIEPSEIAENSNLPPRFRIKSLSGYASKVVKMFAAFAGDGSERDYCEPISTESTALLPFIFIIDEINRGEISKIFGELFFSLDPSYRGKAGEVSTQYANLHENPNEKFYVSDNVYIIGTMNDIDRSVDSFDFAMRRRFRFIEIKASEQLEMLNELENKEEAIHRMNSLNEVISNIEELNENYHIGASYFLKLKTIGFEELWTDYLAPLLHEYVRGMYDEKGILEKLKVAYEKSGISNDDESKR